MERMMRRKVMHWIGVAVTGGTLMLDAAGCSYSCEDLLSCVPLEERGGGSGTGGTGGSGGGEPDPCPDDPAEGFVREDCGVWLSASLGDDSHPGTQSRPVQTLTKAIERAQAGTGRIYACGETYVGEFVLPAGISLAGGFACGGHGWAYAGEEKPAILVSTVPGAHTLTLLAGEKAALLTDLEVEAADAQVPGGSSIPVFSFGARWSILRSRLIAGDGADGADGEPGDHDNAPAKKGFSGNDGENACTNDVGFGGAAVELQCEAGGVISTGGPGGDGGAAAANDGSAGLQPPDPNDLGYGAGGKGENALLGNACTPGIGGAQGNSGAHGFGATGQGQLTEEGYVGVAGGNGVSGTPGQGGGGGGGSIGSLACGDKKGGAGGGSGGTGGCGGKAGQGGKPGGSSFGLAVVAGVVRVEDVRIITGHGGNGGNGGAGQLGGQGGLPGLQGMGFGPIVKAACAGGAGGAGGNGGSGGGGLGGHSAGAAYATGAYVEQISPVDVVTGEVGQGGKGGNPAVEGTEGEAGTKSPTLELAP